MKNVSSRPINNIEAVAEYYMDDGTFVTSDSALVEFNPLMPGQTTPYEVLLPNNPLIKKCNIRFKLFAGSELAYETPETQAARNPEVSKAMIIKAQHLLNRLGYDAGTADGIVGPKTVTAINNFQREFGIYETGKVEDVLIQHLSNRAAIVGVSLE